MQKIEKIDALDKKILSILSKNARMPFKDVATECNVSRAAIHQRVQRLIEIGVILGSAFNINPKALGYNTCTYVGITLERGNMYREVAKQIALIPEIVECHYTTGSYTMLVKLYARDNEQLMELLNDKLQNINGVVSTETLISLEQSIKREIPVAYEDAEEYPSRPPPPSLSPRLPAASPCCLPHCAAPIRAGLARRQQSEAASLLQHPRT